MIISKLLQRKFEYLSSKLIYVSSEATRPRTPRCFQVLDYPVLPMGHDRFPQSQDSRCHHPRRISVIRRMLESGVHGYVLKSAPIDELITAIEQVWKGQRYISPAVEAIHTSTDR